MINTILKKIFFRVSGNFFAGNSNTGEDKYITKYKRGDTEPSVDQQIGTPGSQIASRICSGYFRVTHNLPETFIDKTLVNSSRKEKTDK